MAYPAKTDWNSSNGVADADINRWEKGIADADIQLRNVELENVGYGVRNGLGVTAAGTPNMTVTIAAGVIYMPGGERYSFSNPASVTVVAADATNPRKDIIFISSTGVMTYLAGTPAATPAEPALPAGAMKLCVIDVPAADTAIEQAQITDSRIMKPKVWTSANGGSGSGLLADDSDKVDGKHWTDIQNEILSKFVSEATTGTLDWNHATNTQPGVGPTLLKGNATSGPGPDAYFHALNIEYATNNGTGNVTQLAVPYAPSVNIGIYMRGRYNGNWTAWSRLWDTSQMRINTTGGYLEVLIGGVWRPVGGMQVGRKRYTSLTLANATAANTYVTVLDLTSVQGRLDSLRVLSSQMGATGNLRVTIDGVAEVMPFTNAASDGTGTKYSYHYFLGNHQWGDGAASTVTTDKISNHADAPIEFYSSLKVEVSLGSTVDSAYPTTATAAYALKLGSA